MIGAIITGFRVVTGFFSAYKWAITSVVVLSAASGIYLYMANHEKMKAQIPGLRHEVAQCVSTNNSLRRHVLNQNERIERENVEQLEKLAEAQKLIRDWERIAEGLDWENYELREQLNQQRYRNVEVIRDNEEFADWVDIMVPPVAWGLLRDAAEGPITRSN